MVKCPDCKQEMHSGRPCTMDMVGMVNGGTTKWYKRKPYIPNGYPCHDCGVAHKGYHHGGCDMERCPKCGGQLISCGCAKKIIFESSTKLGGQPVNLVKKAFGEPKMAAKKGTGKKVFGGNGLEAPKNAFGFADIKIGKAGKKRN